MTTEAQTSGYDKEKLLKSGVHFGHPSKRWNARMAPFIYKKHNKSHIIDIRQTQERLKTACDFIERLAAKDGKILVVGTKRHIKQTTTEEAERGELWYVTERWLGGMLTNFETIENRIKELIQLENDMEKGTIKMRTKKEELRTKVKINRLSKYFGGVKEMDRLPDALIIVDTNEESLAVKEAIIKDVPCIALVDTDSDPTCVQYPIPANDDSIASVQTILRILVDAVLTGKEKHRSAEQERLAAELEIEMRETAAREEMQRKAAEQQAELEKRKAAEEKAKPKTAAAEPKAEATSTKPVEAKAEEKAKPKTATAEPKAEATSTKPAEAKAEKKAKSKTAAPEPKAEATSAESVEVKTEEKADEQPAPTADAKKTDPTDGSESSEPKAE